MTVYSLPPGPPPVNNILAVIRVVSMFRRNPLEAFRTYYHQHGQTYAMQFGDVYNFITSDPELMHEIMVTKAASFYKDRDLKSRKTGLARFLGNGLLISDGEFWKRQRRLAAPALHARRIAAYAGTMVDYTSTMLDGWHDGARLDISHQMSALTMKIVARTLFDADVSGIVGRVGDALTVVQETGGAPPLLPTWIPTPAEYRKRRTRRELDNIIYGMIENWRKTREDKGDLMSMLLLAEDEDGRHMSDEQARDEVVTLFLAGHETTANALNWTWVLLSQNPEVEAKLHHELDTVLAGRPPTLADLERLPYTEWVIKESMRLYPPAWIIGREAIEDVEVGSYFVPKGTQFNLIFYFTHHDPRWWDAPQQFRPERFSPDNEASLNKRAYTPFGGGPRVCIGNSFAMMEARLLLATIAQRYRLSLTPGQIVAMNPRITLNPNGGLPMTLHIRQPVTAPVHELEAV